MKTLNTEQVEQVNGGNHGANSFHPGEGSGRISIVKRGDKLLCSYAGGKRNGRLLGCALKNSPPERVPRNRDEVTFSASRAWGR